MAAVAAFATGAEVSVAFVARFWTNREYRPATASEPAVAVATVASAMLALNPASALGVSSGVNVACSVDSALLKVPNAEICALRLVTWLVIWAC
jgi:hypothetical protein